MNQYLPARWQAWTVKKQIGKGAYGSVYLVEKDHIASVIKIIRVPEDDVAYDQLLQEYYSREALEAYLESLTRKMKKEIEIMLELQDHPNIVQIMDYEEDYEHLKSLCYEEDLEHTLYTELAHIGDKYYCEILHYEVTAPYPDPASYVDLRRMEYTIQARQDGFYLVMEDDEIVRAQLDTFPQGYQSAQNADRNTELYPLAYHWADENLILEDAVIFDTAMLWQNEDRSLDLQIFISNGTEQERIINDMDYQVTDQQLGEVASGKCTDEYRVAAGETIHYEIHIPAGQVETGWKEWNQVDVEFSPNID